jgi:hypothetical protein
MLRYAVSLVQELYAPLVTAIATDGVGMMGTVLLCETLLSLLPTMSTKNAPYGLLKEYNITPIGSGVMASERHLCLRRFARLSGDVLHIARPVIHRVFVPLNHLPAEGRRQVVRMLRLLDAIRTGDGDSVADKCSKILVKSMIDDLLNSRLISRRAVLMSSQQLVSSGCTIHSIIAAAHLVARIFCVRYLPESSRLRDFLKTAEELCGDRLGSALADEVIREISFMPRVIVHDNCRSFSATSYYVLSKLSLAEIRRKARNGTLTVEDCMPILSAVEVTLLTSFSTDSCIIKRVTR